MICLEAVLIRFCNSPCPSHLPKLGRNSSIVPKHKFVEWLIWIWLTAQWNVEVAMLSNVRPGVRLAGCKCNSGKHAKGGRPNPGSPEIKPTVRLCWFAKRALCWGVHMYRV